MKDMVYTDTRRLTVLYEGVYKGYGFYILSLGTHPTAYVECKLKKCKGHDDKRLDEVFVHGGFTYHGKPSWNTVDTKDYLGWDYAHSGDYIGYSKLFPDVVDKGKKWTTEEVYEDVKLVIEQLKMEKAVETIKVTSQVLNIVACVLFAVSLGLFIVQTCTEGFSPVRILLIVFTCVVLAWTVVQLWQRRA